MASSWLAAVLPLTEVVKIRGHEASAVGIEIPELVSVVTRFPEIADLFLGRIGQEVLAKSPAMLAAFIAAGLRIDGKPLDAADETGIANLSLAERLKLYAVVMRLTAPDGDLLPFADALTASGFKPVPAP